MMDAKLKIAVDGLKEALSMKNIVGMKAFIFTVLAAIDAEQPAAQEDAKDAARWKTALRFVGGEGNQFVIRGLEPLTGANIMRGSVAEHFTNAIDAARAAEGK